MIEERAAATHALEKAPAYYVFLPYLTFQATQEKSFVTIPFFWQATLASVIMTAVLFSVDHHIVAPMWRASSEYTPSIQKTNLLTISNNQLIQ